MNNPKNPDVRGVKLHEIQRLFPYCEIRMHRITLNVVDIWLSRFAHFLAGEIVAQHRGGLRLNTFLLSTEALLERSP